MNLDKRIAALCFALVATPIGCKKPSESPQPASRTFGIKRARGPGARHGIPKKYDPTRKMAGRAPVRTKVPLARLRKVAGPRSMPTRVGQGSLGFTLAGKKVHLPVQVYEHRGRYHLTAQRPGLSATLVLKSLKPGKYPRSAASRWPSLKLSLGSGRALRRLASTTDKTGRKMPALKVLIRRSGKAVSGMFSGQVRGPAGKASVLSAGTFTIRIGVASPKRRRRVLRRPSR